MSTVPQSHIDTEQLRECQTFLRRLAGSTRGQVSHVARYINRQIKAGAPAPVIQLLSEKMMSYRREGGIPTSDWFIAHAKTLIRHRYPHELVLEIIRCLEQQIDSASAEHFIRYGCEIAILYGRIGDQTRALSQLIQAERAMEKLRSTIRTHHKQTIARARQQITGQ